MSSRFFDRLRGGEVRLDISASIIKELTQVLRVRFGWDGYSIQALNQRFHAVANVVALSIALDVVPDGPDDNRIIERAVRAS